MHGVEGLSEPSRIGSAMKFSIKSARWFIGPIAGIVLVGLAVILNVGAGVATLSLLSAIAFVFVAPLVQLMLLRTRLLQGRVGVAGAVACLLVVVAMSVALASGAFSFW